MLLLQEAVVEIQQQQEQAEAEQVAIVLQSLVKTQVAEHQQNL
jgi:hypothetical protein